MRHKDPRPAGYVGADIPGAAGRPQRDRRYLVDAEPAQAPCSGRRSRTRWPARRANGEAHVQRRDFSMTPLSSRSAPMRLASLVTAINVLVAAGFSIAWPVRPKSVLPSGYAPTEASFIFAMYAAARTITLAFIALIAIFQQS